MFDHVGFAGLMSAGFEAYRPRKYGYYSKMAAERYGSSIWLTPEGKEVEITFFSPRYTPGYYWEDRVFVGEINSFIRVAQKGTHKHPLASI